VKARPADLTLRKKLVDAALKVRAGEREVELNCLRGAPLGTRCEREREKLSSHCLRGCSSWHKVGRTAEAVAAARDLAEKTPNDADAWFVLGVALQTASAAARTRRPLGDAESSLGDAKSTPGDANSSLGDAKSTPGDAKSSLGDAKSTPGDAESSLGDAARTGRPQPPPGESAQASFALLKSPMNRKALRIEIPSQFERPIETPNEFQETLLNSLFVLLPPASARA
jgi:hypothetical protein